MEDLCSVELKLLSIFRDKEFLLYLLNSDEVFHFFTVILYKHSSVQYSAVHTDSILCPSDLFAIFFSEGRRGMHAYPGKL